MQLDMSEKGHTHHLRRGRKRSTDGPNLKFTFSSRMFRTKKSEAVSVGRAVTSASTDPRFESSYRQILLKLR